ncbi:hypothetical protein C8J56DRAFT_892258 [Mycena floridula]|nr:hypothetical protein C8J56DRAFT_892258 [Mycena floridula]
MSRLFLILAVLPVHVLFGAKDAGGRRWEGAGMCAPYGYGDDGDSFFGDDSFDDSVTGVKAKEKSRIAPLPKSPPVHPPSTITHHITNTVDNCLHQHPLDTEIPTPVEKVDGDLVIPRDLAKMSDEELDGEEESATTKTGTGVGRPASRILYLRIQHRPTSKSDPYAASGMMWLGMDVFETALETQMSVQSPSNLHQSSGRGGAVPVINIGHQSSTGRDLNGVKEVGIKF